MAPRADFELLRASRQSARSDQVCPAALIHCSLVLDYMLGDEQPEDHGGCRLRDWERRLRFLLVWVLFALLALFYTVDLFTISCLSV